MRSAAARMAGALAMLRVFARAAGGALGAPDATARVLPLMPPKRSANDADGMLDVTSSDATRTGAPRTSAVVRRLEKLASR